MAGVDQGLWLLQIIPAQLCVVQCADAGPSELRVLARGLGEQRTCSLKKKSGAVSKLHEITIITTLTTTLFIFGI